MKTSFTKRAANIQGLAVNRESSETGTMSNVQVINNSYKFLNVDANISRREIIKLQAIKIETLKKELEMKDKAISSFKKWQKNMVGFKCGQWLREGLNIFEDVKDKECINELMEFFKTYKMYVDYYEKMDKIRKSLMRHGTAMHKISNQLGINK